MNSKQKRLSLLLCLGLEACGGNLPVISALVPRAAPKSSTVNVAAYLQQLQRMGGTLRDLTGIVEARMMDKMKQHKGMSFRVRFAFQTPDSLRMEVLSSSNGLFQGWRFARVGSRVQVYDPISERATALDVSQLTGRQPIRMDTGLDMAAALFHPERYTPSLVGKTTLVGRPALLVRLLPRPGTTPPNAIVKLSSIMLWLDPARKVPLRQETYGIPTGEQRHNTKVRRLMTAEFLSFKSAGGGLWYPDQVRLTSDRAMRIEGGRNSSNATTIKLTRINGTLVPLEVSSTGRDDASVLRYSDLKVNTGLPPSAFRVER